MNVLLKRVVWWMPRVLGLAYAAFLALFALDVFQDNGSIVEKMGGLAVHLIPSALVLAAVLTTWRYERLGALILAGLGAGYAIWTRGHPSWIVVIAGPLWVIAALFVLSGRGGSAARLGGQSA